MLNYKIVSHVGQDRSAMDRATASVATAAARLRHVGISSEPECPPELKDIWPLIDQVEKLQTRLDSTDTVSVDTIDITPVIRLITFMTKLPVEVEKDGRESLTIKPIVLLSNWRKAAKGGISKKGLHKYQTDMSRVVKEAVVNACVDHIYDTGRCLDVSTERTVVIPLLHQRIVCFELYMQFDFPKYEKDHEEVLFSGERAASYTCILLHNLEHLVKEDTHITRKWIIARHRNLFFSDTKTTRVSTGKGKKKKKKTVTTTIPAKWLNTPNDYRNIAELLSMTGYADKAEQALNQGLDKYKRNRDILLALGEFHLIERKDHQAADIYFKKLAEIELEKDPCERSDFYIIKYMEVLNDWGQWGALEDLVADGLIKWLMTITTSKDYNKMLLVLKALTYLDEDYFEQRETICQTLEEKWGDSDVEWISYKIELESDRSKFENAIRYLGQLRDRYGKIAQGGNDEAVLIFTQHTIIRNIWDISNEEHSDHDAAELSKQVIDIYPNPQVVAHVVTIYLQEVLQTTEIRKVYDKIQDILTRELQHSPTDPTLAILACRFAMDKRAHDIPWPGDSIVLPELHQHIVATWKYTCGIDYAPKRALAQTRQTAQCIEKWEGRSDTHTNRELGNFLDWELYRILNIQLRLYTLHYKLAEQKPGDTTEMLKLPLYQLLTNSSHPISDELTGSAIATLYMPTDKDDLPLLHQLAMQNSQIAQEYYDYVAHQVHLIDERAETLRTFMEELEPEKASLKTLHKLTVCVRELEENFHMDTESCVSEEEFNTLLDSTKAENRPTSDDDAIIDRESAYIKLENYVNRFHAQVKMHNIRWRAICTQPLPGGQNIFARMAEDAAERESVLSWSSRAESLGSVASGISRLSDPGYASARSATPRYPKFPAAAVGVDPPEELPEFGARNAKQGRREGQRARINRLRKEGVVTLRRPGGGSGHVHLFNKKGHRITTLAHGAAVGTRHAIDKDLEAELDQ